MRKNSGFELSEIELSEVTGGLDRQLVRRLQKADFDDQERADSLKSRARAAVAKLIEARGQSGCC